jgi:membrane peptidoglycan carboxypeptidase
VIDPLTAYQMTHIMEGVIQRGTGIAIKEVGKTLAGKTGTTNDAKDLWFLGFSPNLAFGVFMGYDKPRSLGGSAQAALYTAPIFRDFMKMALKDTPAFRPASSSFQSTCTPACARPGLARSWKRSSPVPDRPTPTRAGVNHLKPRRVRDAGNRLVRKQAGCIEHAVRRRGAARLGGRDELGQPLIGGR